MKSAQTEVVPATEEIKSFRVSVNQEALEDLRARLDRTRLPTKEPVDDWSQGVPLSRAANLIEYWRTSYDWRRFEAQLNRFPHFRTLLDGLGIHFIHERSPHADALPIILTHGWPGSVAEFLEVVEPLSNPTAFDGSAGDAFHVVVPSLPGFAFSDKPAETGWNLPRIAKAWSSLMQRLGYDRWVAQSGDWGAGVTTALGHLVPAGLVGIHLNWQFVFPEHVPNDLSPDEQRTVDGAKNFLGDGNGYFRQQSTRPQTIAYAGQAAWIYEKFYSWTDNNGSPEDALSVDQMLDNISLYWFTNTAASSGRIYCENKDASFSGGKLSLPVAATVFPHEIFRAPRSWAEQTYSNLIYWNEATRGGHFAAFEEPDVFVEEIRAAFRALRSP